MIDFIRTHHRIAIALVVSAGIVAGILVFPKAKPHAGSSPNKNSSQQVTNKSQPSANQSPAPDAATAEASTHTPPACGHIDLSLAKTVLGGNPQLIENETRTLADDPDIRTDQCTYRSDGSTVRVMSFIAKSSLGDSTNAVAFGSGRPAGVQSEQGYGQSAYWNTDTSTLSVLKNNNRYDLTRTPATYDAVKKAANSIVPKL